MKITLIHKTQQQNKSGECEVFFRLRNPSGDVKISTDIFLQPKDFKNGNIKISHPNYKSYNLTLLRIRKDLDFIIDNFVENEESFTPKMVKFKYDELVSNREDDEIELLDFWKGFEEYLETKKLKSYGYLKTIKTLENHLRHFEIKCGRKLSYEWVIRKTHLFQTEFNEYLWNDKGLSNSYVNKLYDNLSGFFYYSHQSGYIKIKPKFKLEQTYEVDEKIYLNTDEVIKLFNSQKWSYSEKNENTLLKKENIRIVSDELRGSNKEKFDGVLKVTNWELVKDIFLWLNSTGMRIGDVKTIRINNMNFDRKTQLISWTQTKTSKMVSVPLNDISGYIFTKYSRGKSLEQFLFPKVSQQKFNKQLKNLLKDLRFNRMVSKPMRVGSKVVNSEPKPLWELISSHSGRRGFIKNSIDLGNMDYSTIMKLSGHKTFSEFSKYISVTQTDVLKSRGLYSLETPEDGMGKKLLMLFNKLTDDEKRSVFGIVQSMNKK
jgi:integrase